MNGFYNVIKPIGKSSSDLVVKIRGILTKELGRKVKVGHLGTLDPLATGVLGVAVGSATKLFDYFLTKRKTYVATCTLGKETDTLDSAGEIIAEKEVGTLSDEAIGMALSSFVGTIEQIPPRYSAKSIGGVRAYRLALKGVEPELKPCSVTIFSMQLLERITENSFRFRVECSGGTYIRSLCRDLGRALGYPAYMSALERVKNGNMDIRDAVELDAIRQDIRSGFTSLKEFGASLKRSDFSEKFRKAIENGVKQETKEADGLTAVYIEDGFYGIGEIKDGVMKIIAREI